MLHLIVKFYPLGLHTLDNAREKEIRPFNYLTRVTNREESIVFGVWLYLPVSIMSLWLLIRIFTNSFWASAVTGRIPEGCKWPLARAEISKWKKRERKRERSRNKVWLRFVLRVVHCIQKPFSVLKFKSIRW